MSSSRSDGTRERLEIRAFEKNSFAIGWVVFLALMVRLAWPIRDRFLVYWVYGRDAYIREGVRVLPGKPVHFSTGARAPTGLDVVPGGLLFVIVAFGLTALLILGFRLYERASKRKKA